MKFHTQQCSYVLIYYCFIEKHLMSTDNTVFTIANHFQYVTKFALTNHIVKSILLFKYCSHTRAPSRYGNNKAIAGHVFYRQFS